MRLIPSPGAIPISAFFLPGVALIGAGAWVMVRAHQRGGPDWPHGVGGFMIVLGLGSIRISLRTMSDGPQTYSSFRRAFSSFYGNNWIYPLAFGAVVGAAIVLATAGRTRTRITARRSGAVIAGCVTAAVIIGLLDTSISPI